MIFVSFLSVSPEEDESILTGFFEEEGVALASAICKDLIEKRSLSILCSNMTEVVDILAPISSVLSIVPLKKHLQTRKHTRHESLALDDKSEEEKEPTDNKKQRNQE